MRFVNIVVGKLNKIGTHFFANKFTKTIYLVFESSQCRSGPRFTLTNHVGSAMVNMMVNMDEMGDSLKRLVTHQ